MQLVAFTKRVQSNNRVTEQYTGEQLFYCYDSWCEKCMYPGLTDHVSPPLGYVGNFDHFQPRCCRCGICFCIHISAVKCYHVQTQTRAPTPKKNELRNQDKSQCRWSHDLTPDCFNAKIVRTSVYGVRPTKWRELFIRYLYDNITLNFPTCFDPEGTTIIRESNQSNAAQN